MFIWPIPMSPCEFLGQTHSSLPDQPIVLPFVPNRRSRFLRLGTDALILRSKRKHQAFGSIILAETRLRLFHSFCMSLKKCSLSLLWLCLKIFDQIYDMRSSKYGKSLVIWQLEVVSHIGIAPWDSPMGQLMIQPFHWRPWNLILEIISDFMSRFQPEEVEIPQQVVLVGSSMSINHWSHWNGWEME